MADGQLRTASSEEKSKNPDESSLEEGFHGDVLVFCNPGVPSVLNPDQHSKEGCSSDPVCPDLPTAPSTHSSLQSNHAETSISHESADQQTLRLTKTLPCSAATTHSNCNACIGCTGWSQQENSVRKRWKGGLVEGTIAVISSLLSSLLVLANGLTVLLSGTDCSQLRPACLLLPYLDPVFSVVSVLVLMATTLPELCRFALVLLQATPAHMCVEKVKASICRVPGVLAVHELHVWQLSEMRLVASVHVHCPSGLGAVECSELLATITQVLSGFGVSSCTVQPEFIPTHDKDPPCSGAVAGSLLPDVEGAAVQPHCSLQCGKECAKKMCCSPPQVRPCPRVPSTVDMAMTQLDIVLENPYL